MQKNTVSQKWIVFAFNRTTNAPLTGDAANITANIDIDFAGSGATNDVNPTEQEDGYYAFDLTQAETNGDQLVLYPASSTSNIQVIGVPGAVFTTPASFPDAVVQSGDVFAQLPTNFSALSISAGGLVDILQTAADKVWASAARTLTAFSSGFKTGYALSATGADLITKTSTFALAIAAVVWEDTLTTYTNGMAGKRVKGITAVPVDEGTVNDVGATTTTIITTLTGVADNHYKDALFVVEIATDQWQGRPILSNNGASGQIILDEALTSAPANGVNVAIQAHHIHPITQIQAGLATEAKQDATDVVVDGLATTLGTAGAGLTDLGGMSTAMKAEVLAEIVKILTTQMAESYAADGVAPTQTQALMLIQQTLTEFAITGTSYRVNKLDGVTQAAIMTLNDSADPSAATRSA